MLGWTRLAAGATASGAILQLSFPPVSFWCLIFAAFAPVVVVLHGKTPSTWAWAGALFGLVTFAGAPPAMIAWGWEVYLGIWVLASSVFGGIFAGAGWLESRVPEAAKWLALPCCWTLGVWFAESVLRIPLSLSLGFGLARPELLGISRTFGLASVDFSVVAFSAVLAAWWCGSLGGARSLAICTGFALILGTGFLHAAPRSGHSIKIAGVQPAISLAESRSWYWSVATRSSVELRLDELTRSALDRGASLVVWPEGGNELYNRRLPRRREKLRQLLQGTRAEILASGRDLTPEGRLYTTVSHISSDGFQSDARKSKLVHVAERDVAPGEPTVFDTRVGRVGISICFDAIFANHVSALIDQGAEALIVVTDDSSFGEAALQDWHVAFAVARAVEAGRALFLIGNHGMSLATDVRGGVLAANWTGRQPAVYLWDLPTTEGSVPAQRGGRSGFYCATVMIIPLILVAGRKGDRRRLQGALDLGALLSAGLAVPLGVLLSLAVVSLGRQTEPTRVVQDIYRRYAGDGAGLGHVAAFRQTGSRSCGAAALAYTLTMLGDVIFEPEIVGLVSPMSERGYSFSELREAAASRGFNARGFAGKWDDLPRSGRPPVIAHWSRGHFVTVHEVDDERAILFDPAVGRLVKLDRTRFESEWSGRFLVLETLDEGALREAEGGT